MRHDPDRGSATVWAAGAMALVWLAASVAFAHGAAVTGRHRAETAADLAALAAAVHVLTGDACTVAAEVAGRNGGVLSGCRIAGEDVEVEVRRPVRRHPHDRPLRHRAIIPGRVRRRRRGRRGGAGRRCGRGRR